MNIDFRSIVYFLNMQNKTANEILIEINETFGEKMIGYSTITKYLREQIYDNSKKVFKDDDENHRVEFQQEIIVKSLQNNQFGTLREIAKNTGIPKSTVHRILTQQLMYKITRIRYVPHFLNFSQKMKRVRLSKQLLSIIEAQRHNSYNFF